MASSGVNIINSNALTYVGNILSSTVNGVTSAIPVTVVTAVNNGLTLSGSSAQLGGALTQPTTFTTTASNTLTLAGLQTGTSTDNILVATSGGVIKQIPQVSFPQLLIDVRRTNSYSPTATYSTLVYNTAIINTGTAYNTTTGEFTAPETGIYEIIINNGYNLSSGNVQIVNRINVNGAIDMEKYLSSPKNTTSTTISGNDIVSLTAGQTINITVGGEIGTVTPLVGTGQHVMKIIRLL